MPNELPALPITPPLGRLHRVGLREVWPNEAVQFTPWLASPDNIGLLGETVGIQLIDVRTEGTMGGFSSDVVAL